MDLSNLSRGNKKVQKRKRVGRGHATGQGKTSGRGHKGQKARSGYSRRIGFEGGQTPLHRRLPRRGFNHQDRWPTAVINLDLLDKVYNDGAEITTADLVARGLAHKLAGGVKVLGRGEVTKKFTLKVQSASGSAKTKIEAAGGSIEIVAAPKTETPEEAKA